MSLSAGRSSTVAASIVVTLDRCIQEAGAGTVSAMSHAAGNLAVRHAAPADLAALTAFNMDLIEDQVHDNPSGPAELERRMRGWLSGAYRVALIEADGASVAYAVWREGEDGVYLRQLFVVREQRRAGIGRRAFELLAQEWTGPDVTLDVPPHNERALGCRRSLGFTITA